MSNRETKKSYEKPVVKRFPLRAQEAVLGFCKSSGFAAPGQPASSGCHSVLCKAAGS